MSIMTHRILEQALQLPQEERVEVARRLLQSVEPSSIGPDLGRREVVQGAVEDWQDLEALTQLPGMPPGGGAFDSGKTDTAERAEEILTELGFGENSH